VSTARQIDEAYVKTGQVRVVFKNRAVLGPESVWAAEAALCAADQGKFWQYHDKLFENWAGENQGAFSKANLKRFASDLGLDAGAFGSCLDGDKTLTQVKNETQESQARGVHGTPSFFINDELVEGALRFEEFRRVIDSLLR
jgi:protein-disulfide isomerase